MLQRLCRIAPFILIWANQNHPFYVIRCNMKEVATLLLALTIGITSSCQPIEKKKNTVEIATPVEATELSKSSTAYFASGCFWCVEAIFESVKGVHEVESGYSGGEEKNPTYKQVSAGQTGHTESVKVYYDPEVVDYATLVKVFYGSHDPTTVNGQHPDYGRQYRSAIFYQTDAERKIVEDYIKKIGKEYAKPIVTEVTAYKKFWIAEDYHQNFEKLNPNQSYVKAVSIPRLNRFKAKFPELLKEEAKLKH